MLTIGSKHLRKRYNGTTNVGTVYQGNNEIWPYIVNSQIGEWVLTLYSNLVGVGAEGGPVIITSTCKRTVTDTWVNYEGNTDELHTESRKEYGTVNLSSDIGTIVDRTLTIPENTGEARTITVTATSNGITKTITINQEAGVSYKYYAVTTDAYQVTAEGQTKTVTLVSNSGPTNSYHYGTVVFKIAEGPDTINASFISKDYDLGVKGGVCSLSPITNYLALNAMTLRVLAVGSKLYNKKLMTVPDDVVLTGYNTESEATANAQEYLCTIEDTGYLPYSDTVTLNSDSKVNINLISEEITDEAYYAIYDLVLPEVEEDGNEDVSINVNTSRVQKSISFSRTSSSSIAINDVYNRFSINSIINAINDNVLLFTATPNNGLTIDNCANTSFTNLESYFGTEGINNNFFANAADGSSVTIDASNVASTTLYVYEWLSDTSEFIKLGEFKLSLGSVQAFVYNNGVANSLVRKLLYPELTDPDTYTLQLVDTNTSSNVEGNAYYLFKGIPQESTTASYYALQGNQDLTHTGSLQVNGETAGQMVDAVIGDIISIYQLVGVNSDDGAITSSWQVVTAFELEAANQRIEFKTYSNE